MLKWGHFHAVAVGFSEYLYAVISPHCLNPVRSFVFFVVVVVLGPHPWHIGGSQAQRRIRAVATGLRHSHSNAGSLTH